MEYDDQELREELEAIALEIDSYVKDNGLYVDVNTLLFLYEEHAEAIERLIEDEGVAENDPRILAQGVVLHTMALMYQSFVKKHVEELTFFDDDSFDEELETLIKDHKNGNQ